jgi:aspartyl-tRNA(Asn)/glutamyl-tRNA(Gln) amidotransferase subunit B
MKYLSTIGLEIHVQLRTLSKMFCGCGTAFGAAPNTQVCPVCLGYPGAMPTANEEAIRLTVLAGLMLDCVIPPRSKFDRKSYFYPDMPKNYQITQYDQPLCVGGGLEIECGGAVRRVGITRIHLEEDVGKNMHFQTVSGVDFNRAGVPLMEIVTEPDMTSPDEAFAFLLALKQILLYAGVSDCDLEKGNMRCDVNSSVRPEGQATLGTKTEIKNLNTFKGVHNALRYELDRQRDVLDSGGRVVQETRRWDMDTGMTHSMRSKEDAHDYRYFPEPDLVSIAIGAERVAAWRAALPERPRQRRERFAREYGLPEYDAGVLVADKSVGDFFEAAARLSASAKAVSNWIMTDFLRVLSERGVEVGDVAMTPASLASLVNLVDAGTINIPTAKVLFAELVEKGGDPAAMVRDRGLGQVSDDGALERLVDQAVEENPRSVADYRGGKVVAAKFLMGQVMRLSKGKADPRRVAVLMEARLQKNDG